MHLANCEDVRPDLSAYVDGELAASAARAVEAHLHECAACRADLDALREVRDGLAALPRARVPFDLSADVQREFVRERLAPRARGADRWHRVATALRLGASAALIVLCVAITWRVLERPLAAPRAAPLAERGAPPSPSDLEVAVRSMPPGKLESDMLPVSSGLTDGEGPPVTGSLAKAPIAGREIAGLAGGPMDRLGQTVPPAEEPVVEVTVTPQTAAEYTNTLAVLSRASATYAFAAVSPSEIADDERLRSGFRGAMVRAPEGVQTTHFEFQVPPQEVWPLINTLESNAPQQIGVAMSFRGQDAMQLRQQAWPEHGRGVAADLVLRDANEPSAGIDVTRADRDEAAVYREEPPRESSEALRLRSLGNGADRTGDRLREESPADDEASRASRKSADQVEPQTHPAERGLIAAESAGRETRREGGAPGAGAAARGAAPSAGERAAPVPGSAPIADGARGEKVEAQSGVPVDGVQPSPAALLRGRYGQAGFGGRADAARQPAVTFRVFIQPPQTTSRPAASQPSEK